MRILVVEEETRTAVALDRELGRSGYEVDAVGSGEEAIEHATEPDIALVVLDLDAIEDDAIGALSRLSGNARAAPVVVLAQRDALEREPALGSRASDVVVKPHSAKELATRVRVRLERARRRRQRPLSAGAVRLDPAARRATVRGRSVRLSGRECELLRALMRDPGRVLSRDELLAQVWGIEFAARTNVVGIYVSYLRRKLGRAAIETVRGHGYRMAAE